MKLPQISGYEVIKRLHRVGYIATRQQGSHVRLEKRTSTGEMIKLTVPLHNEMKKGTLHRIIKDAQLTLEEFQDLK